MLQTLKNAWSTKDFRSKILFTLFILLIYRVGTVIPVPFVESNGFASSLNGTILQYMNVLSGGSLGAMTLFALGVQPYINASIIIQLLAVVFPKLGELGKTDKKKMNFITRAITVVLAIVTAIGYYFLLRNGNQGQTFLAARAFDGDLAWLYGIVIVSCYVAGAMLIMWLAERINEKGIGNGISMILFANIIAAVPSFVYNLVGLVVDTYSYPDKAWLYALVSTVFAVLLIALLLGLIAYVIYVTGSERRIPVQYAKKVVGRKMYGGQSSNLPIKLNMTGVMPIIFASSIVSFLPTVFQILESAGVISDTETPGWAKFADIIGSEGAVYPILLFILIIAFAYFYTQITFDPMEVANNLKQQGGAIPGIRQGRPTADYIRKILNKITLAGALFLGFIAVLPIILGPHAFGPLFDWIFGGSGVYDYYFSQYAGYGTELADQLATMYTETWATQQSSYLVSVFTFGGTTLLIVVGVAIETFRELEAQLTMRNYKGFLN